MAPAAKRRKPPASARPARTRCFDGLRVSYTQLITRRVRELGVYSVLILATPTWCVRVCTVRCVVSCVRVVVEVVVVMRPSSEYITRPDLRVRS